MAERYAVQNGNWSDAAIWDGGTLPTAVDDVHANRFSVTIDIDVTVISVRTSDGTSAVAGGRFSTSGSVMVTADSVGGTSRCLTVNSGGIQNGNSTGGSASNAQGSFVLFGGIQNGNSTGGSSFNAHGSLVSVGGIQNGNSTGGSANNANGSLVQNGGIQNGNSTGGSANNAHGSFVQNGGIQNGNSTGGSTNNANGSLVSAGGTQNGNSTGGSVGGAYGSVVSTGGIQNGNSTGGSVGGAHGSTVQSGGVLVLSGVTDTAATAVRVDNAATVIFANPSLSESDLDIQTTLFTIGNANYPFINSPSTGGTAGPTNVFISGVFG